MLVRSRAQTRMRPGFSGFRWKSFRGRVNARVSLVSLSINHGKVVCQNLEPSETSSKG